MTHQERVKIMKSHILSDSTDFEKAITYFWDNMMMFESEFMKSDKYDKKEAKFLQSHVKIALKSMIKHHPELRTLSENDFSLNTIYIKKHKFYHFQILGLQKFHAGMAIILPGHLKGVIALTNLKNSHVFYSRMTTMFHTSNENEVN